MKPYLPGPLITPIDYTGPVLRVAETGVDAFTKINRGADKGAGAKVSDPFYDDF